MRRLIIILAILGLMAGSALTAEAGHNEDDHTENMSLIGSVALAGATDIEFTKDGYAVMTVNGSGEFAGLWIIDVRNPKKPKTAGHLPCAGSGYDVGLWRNVAVMSSDSASGNSTTTGGCNKKGTDNQEGIRLVDISNRHKPKEVKFVATQCGSHTNIVVPKGKKGYVYVQSYPASTSGACPSAHGVISVVDITVPAKASVVAMPSVTPAVGCHDGAIKGKYAYMGCLTEGQIWDISKPTAPTIVSHIRDVPDALWHSAAVSNDGKKAIFGFESFGPGSSSCTGAGQGKSGALWFYDVTDPKAPKQLSSWVPQHQALTGICTAHNFAVIPGKDVLVTAWYNAGVMAVDFSDPSAPKELAHYKVASGTSTWDAKWYRGRIMVGDGTRGLDVYQIKGLK